MGLVVDLGQGMVNMAQSLLVGRRGILQRVDVDLAQGGIFSGNPVGLLLVLGLGTNRAMA